MKFIGEDISQQVYGKYRSGFYHRGKAYSDADESAWFYGKPKFGAIPAPQEEDRRPWHGTFIDWWRQLWP